MAATENAMLAIPAVLRPEPSELDDPPKPAQPPPHWEQQGGSKICWGWVADANMAVPAMTPTVARLISTTPAPIMAGLRRFMGVYGGIEYQLGGTT
jgi:hypothetical protein